ncbi:hypothetical protein [Kineococcus rhizosphaerae]|uniref:Putative membrane-anchored protein n=1 Tax=Kineococcus rhizosphaerae TaxID=559628 RepID=A0A2T0QXI4_9ACTN|nr:hypothetical protein [Kineococcus rhizosphaerae]PRY10747.1 putative membrane-anchored protein [Kineococcus rhizosphaerae]
MTANSPRMTLRTVGNKVPEVTVWFWIVKVLATTVGETFADFLNDTLGLGLSATSIAMTVLLVVVLAAQFRSRTYRPPLYWLTVVLISVVGTLLTDNLSDNLGVPLPVSTAVFAVLLAVTFTVWRRREGTLSIHAVDTGSREGFYWAAILFTFALGTAAGDLIAEQVGLGYLASVGLFALAIAVVALARYGFRANAVGTFWAAYVLTRPLGASLGDLLSQDRSDGGLGLGTTGTSLLFLVVIAAIVVHLTRSRVDRPVLRGHDA